MNRVIRNQFLGQIILLFILIVLIFAAVVTGSVIWIIASIIFGILFILFGLQAIKIIKKEKGIKIKQDINYPIFIIIIVVTTIFGIFLSLLIKRINGIETVAVVQNVDKEINYKTEYDDDGNSYEKKIEDCTVYIKYYADGVEYNNKLDVDTCKYKKDDNIPIYYEKNNPNNFVSSSILILLVGTIFTGLTLIFVIYKCLIKNKIR